MQPKLSIITINFNNLEGLKKTVASVINQTWKDFEWIIVDGGSTDGSKEYIEDLSKTLSGGDGTADTPLWHVEHFSLAGFTAEDMPMESYSSHESGGSRMLLWCSEPDNGIYNAMNKGIAKASGEYLNFMNSGDCFYENETLEKVSAYLERGDADVYIGNTVNIDNGTEIRINDVSCGNLHMFHFMTSGIPHQAVLYSETMFDKYGAFDENLQIVSDWKHAIQMLYFGKAKMQYVPYNICINEGGGISASHAANKERVEVMDTLFHPSIREEIWKLHYYQEEREWVNKYKLTRLIHVFSHKLSTLMQRLGI